MRWADRDRWEGQDTAARAATGGIWLRAVTDRDVPVVAAVTLGVLAGGEAVIRAGVDGAEAREWLVVCLLALATTLPLALMGSSGAPGAAGAVTAASILSLGFFDTLTVAGVVSQLFALYRLGGDTRATTQIAVALAAPFPVLALELVGRDDTGAWVLTILLASLAPAAALAGLMVRARREATVHRAAREAVATSLRENTTRAERARISRELHDVVAHHVSMIAVQAETARLTTPGLPEVGAERLAEIGDMARAALTEMRRLLGVLREDGDGEPAALEPQPDLRQLGELLDQARETSGAAARLILRGPPVRFDPGVELAAYRIVQEALSNARRHAPGAAVDVELHYCDDSLHLRIRDNGPGPPPSPRDGGHGLVGMRERAVAVGGELHTGAAPGGGFLVTADLPAGGDEHR